MVIELLQIDKYNKTICSIIIRSVISIVTSKFNYKLCHLISSSIWEKAIKSYHFIGVHIMETWVNVILDYAIPFSNIECIVQLVLFTK